MVSSASPSTEPVAVEGGSREAHTGGRDSSWQAAIRLLHFVIGVDPRAFWVTILTTLAGSVAEGGGLVLLLPLLSIAGMNLGTSSSASRLAAVVHRILLRSGIPPTLWLASVLGVFLGTAGLRSVLRRSQSMMVYSATMKVELALSRRIYESVVRAQWGYLVRQRSGRLTHLLTEQLRRVAEATYLLLSLINIACLTLLYLAVALKLSAPTTLLVLAMGTALMLLGRRSLERTRRSGEEVNESIGEVYAATEEHLRNMKSVKTYNAEDRDVQLFASLCNDVARHTVENAKHHAGSAFRFEMGSLVALGSVIFLALGVLHVQAAAMLLLLAVFTRLMPQLAGMQGGLHQLASILPSFNDVLAIEDECLRHAEPKAVEAADKDSPPRVEREFVLQHEFVLEDLWFAYDAPQQAGNGLPLEPQPQYVLEDIDLRIEAGVITALVGPSGAGKSTIADLANGLLQPTRGRLLLDGVELAPAEVRRWRSQVGYVGQDTVLFHQSVRQNLRWAQPEATEDEMRDALGRASAEFVYELPGGLDSIVGDRGILLSSGQRQRIALSRALLRNPTLLILDEATNALDVENEAHVLDALRAAIEDSKLSRRPLTVLMIAHRASAVRRADRVVELERGRIVRAEASTGVYSEWR